MKTLIIELLLLFALNQSTFAQTTPIMQASQTLDLSLEEGNHTWAKSESWTWMGHLNEYSLNQSNIVPNKNGIALIHYYTRNQTQFGSLNFKSSALTFTKNGIGEIYDKNTIYADSSNKKDLFQLAINENHLDIEFKHNNELDKIQKTEITDKDLQFLKNKLLPTYPGLKIANQFNPIKYTFSAAVGTKSNLNLDLYQIWPSISPLEAKMQFLGILDAYTFSQPMLVAHGSFENDGVVKPVTGLMFLDRQWCKDYFGKFIMGNPLDSLWQNQALKYSHNWSAFHAHSEQNQNWYFVHLWQQFQRNKNISDELDDYSGIVWVKNGIQQDPIHKDSFDWTGSNFIKNNSKVMLNYAVGRESYFPTEYNLTNKFNNDSLNIQASPKLQSLDQPIYLYEGYASGDGTWDNESVKLQGRLESSRILFRHQDYEQMLIQLKETRSPSAIEDTYQRDLKIHLDKVVKHENKCKHNIFCLDSIFKTKKDQITFMLNDLKQKISIFLSGFKTSKPQRDPKNPSVVIYK
jgi:hypothetical protein